ncbi:MAG: YabP/YqfC family sporulation protein [Clostridia bacterium]|nr:YabP/YqfC family sporulation protein [Clostridia bacterium]
MQENKQSTLTIEQQSKITISGVSSVDAFSDTAISLTVNGKRVQIAGVHLKVLSFSEGSGNFSASGEVTSVKFGAKGGFKKIFK